MTFKYSDYTAEGYQLSAVLHFPTLREGFQHAARGRRRNLCLLFKR